MRKIILSMFYVIFFASYLLGQNMQNPFFSDFKTKYQVPPFDIIKFEHFKPAFLEAIERHKVEIDNVINNKNTPTFDNTIIPMEEAGEMLTRVSGVFYHLYSANTNEDIQNLSMELSPILTKHFNDINLNPKLFERIKVIHNSKDKEKLNAEQQRLLEKYYKGFVREGANLDEKQKGRLREINEQMSLLTLQFSENVLKETNSFELVIDKKEDLDGLPESVINSAKEAADRKGYAGKWVFTLHKPSFIPFLQYAKNRDLREVIFKGYINRANNDNENDNKEIIKKLVELRIERANILGYETHADFVLEESMAKTPDKVWEFLNAIWKPALELAKKERSELQGMINEEGNDFNLEAWDWWYYAEKLKLKKYDLDEELLRPYFKIENVVDGVFEVANRLFGLTFAEVKDLPIYHEDVRVFEIKRADGSLLSILYVDYFPRESKRAGAWMDALRTQSNINGKYVTPIIINVGNFSKPTADKPALLSLDDVNTLFHEFGHALHGMLSDVTYPSLAGTAVSRDFVELPSQIMENWAFDPEVLKLYAKHYQTGEVIPEELVKKIQNSELFNMGFVTVEYMSAAFLDMAYHTKKEYADFDVNKFEEEYLKSIGLIPEIVVRYRGTYFSHIFSGGYSSGYYSYLWAEVLDKDAFAAFEENGIFDKETARKFNKYILSAGDSDDPMNLYVKFRGREPEVEALLKKRGLLGE